MVFPGQNTLRADGVDVDFGKGLAVSVFLAETFAAFLLENDHFVAFYVAYDTGFDAGSFYVGSADLNLAAMVTIANMLKIECGE